MYSDDDLTRAIAGARSWRAVLRQLGLNPGSAGTMRSVQRRAARLGLDHTHFTAGRRWSDDELREAVATAETWATVANRLRLAEGGGTLTSLRAHAQRLGLAVSHLGPRRPMPSPGGVFEAEPRVECIRVAGSMLAASWFMLRGAAVSWPLEPCRYDLLVHFEGLVQRVQVKTTTTRGSGALVHIANSRDNTWALYAPDEIDQFFLVDGDLNAYLVAYAVVAGKACVSLRAYSAFRVITSGHLTVAA